MVWMPAMLLLSMAVTPQPIGDAALNGTWKITALVDNGHAYSDQQIETEFALNRVIHIDGPVIRFQPPFAQYERRLPFVVNGNFSPMHLDISGGEKIGSKGIAALTGDSLIVCLAGPDQSDRPSDFSSSKDSGRVLLTLSRTKPTAPAPLPLPPPPTQAPPAVNPDDKSRKALVGTWGHQDQDSVTYVTFNSDGTFSGVHNYKKGIQRVFHEDVRSSGTWKVENGVVIMQFTASTSAERRNQVYSYRLVSISPTEVIGTDGLGRVRKEWRVR